MRKKKLSEKSVKLQKTLILHVRHGHKHESELMFNHVRITYVHI